MDGFFEILMMVIIIWVFSRGAKGKKKRQPRPPGGEVEASGDREAVDWDEAIGDVLEGLGLPRPDKGEEKQKPRSGPHPEPPESRPAPSASRAELESRRRAELEAQRQAELARSLEVQRAEARRRAEVQRRRARTSEGRGWEVRDVAAEQAAEQGRSRHRARSSDLAEIAGLAEAAARRRASSPVPPASERESQRAPGRPRRPIHGAEEPGLSGAELPPSRPGGLKKLEGLSELERAIIYTEILGPPKALQADEEAGL